VEAIVGMGVPELEARIYTLLLRESPATGYRVAKRMGKSFSTVYKALAALEEKGAILVEKGESRLSRAVPLEEFLEQMEARFRERRKRAEAAAAELPRPPTDTRVYQLGTVDQLYERCRRMLDGAAERALLELFPVPLEVLREPVEKTAARGVDVTVRIYRPDSLAGVRIVQSPFGESTIRELGSEWISVLVDGRQCLLGSLAPGGEAVLQALWTESPLLARSLYDGLNSDLHHYAFRPLLESAADLEEARAAYARLQEAFPPGGDLGTREYFRSIRSNWSAEGAPSRPARARRAPKGKRHVSK
jgi:sugar-specific transcriptional regulator TrmB